MGSQSACIRKETLAVHARTNDLAVHFVQGLQDELHKGALTASSARGGLPPELPRVLIEPDVAPQPLGELSASG
eukprot:1160744-Pelagomonas_calceolata.AAC.8